jgi:ribonuclease HI
MCLPWKAGGVDLKPMRLVNEALMLQLAWKLISEDSQWAVLLRSRYFSKGQPIQHYFKSSVWCGIKPQIATVMANSVWVVGTGEKIHFWTDNWLGDPLVDILQIEPSVHINFTGLLCDVISNAAWNLPDEVSSIPDVASRLAGITLPSSALPDLFSWSHASDGKLSAKLAFSFLRPQAPPLPWASSIWNTCIPPAHSFIFWRLVHGKMPTDDNLASRGCAMVSMCSFCLRSIETSDHLFFYCDFAVSVWTWLGLLLNVVIDHTSALAVFNSIPRPCSSQLHDIFLAAIVHSVHAIWWARNNIRFSSTTPTLHSVQVRVHALIGLSGGLSSGKCIAADAPILDLFRVPHHQRNVKELMMVCWKPPSAPWVKVNTDGSVLVSSGACGGLFRNHLGTFLGAFTCNLGPCSVFDAEVFGYILSMEFAAQQGWTNIWLESDSSSARLAFKNVSLVPIRLRNRWHNACALNIQVICSHIYREGNRCADRLANLGHSVVGEVWLPSLPSEFQQDFFEDRCGLPRLRYP